MRVFSFDTHGSALGYSTTLPSLSTSKTTKQNTVRTSLPLEREGSRILSLRHGLEPHEVALCRACLMPTGEVETPFNTTELTTNTGDDIWEEESTAAAEPQQRVAPLEACQSQRRCKGTDVDDRCLEECVYRQESTRASQNLEIHAQDWRSWTARSPLKICDAGTVNTWLHLPATHPNWQEAAIKDP